MKTISVVIPTFNEEGNVKQAYEKVKKVFLDKLQEYNYEIIFIDNYSKDTTRKIITDICKYDNNVKAIFNAKNFGFTKSTFYGLIQSTGDATVLIFADMQDPPQLIYDFVKEWEKGNKIVIGIKNRSKENRIMYLLRSCYYKMISKIAEIEHINHFTGFGLYDKSFIEVLSKLDDPMPYLRGIVSELGYERKELFYEQQKREYGKSNFNFFKLYDVAMLGITSYSKVVMRIATILGLIASATSMLVAIITICLKIIYWDKYPIGTAAILTGTFFIGSIQLFFIGLLGEYILNINTRVMKRPLVIEDRRINFDTLDSFEIEEKRISF
ncbi:MAG: glycosyltransferase family 2 protein [Clostridium beijerinckii]|jgi:glycosyltransferase involved in cell wall biosynthesis|nr:glycosyltransferase family 2 protein [Clostridium beijerinckii]MCI1577498.1 glycosyltransferase family 2 protein [Clostridium beijerinckii]MCI1583271.1 glycosyltransferase family 2 protein [Clostridium beijerinckii]MCI1621171.1 glycosyltransferase family 2 protein [Clostridium beijerinckii]